MDFSPFWDFAPFWGSKAEKTQTTVINLLVNSTRIAVGNSSTPYDCPCEEKNESHFVQDALIIGMPVAQSKKWVASRLCRKTTKSFKIACEQALHLGDILKSGRARNTRAETRKAAPCGFASRFTRFTRENRELARRLHAKWQTNLLGDKASPIPLAVGLTSDGRGRILFLPWILHSLKAETSVFFIGGAINSA